MVEGAFVPGDAAVSLVLLPASSYTHFGRVLLLQARNSMISKAAVESAAEAAAPGSKEGAWKWAIRKQVCAASWSAGARACAHDSTLISLAECANVPILYVLQSLLLNCVVQMWDYMEENDIAR